MMQIEAFVLYHHDLPEPRVLRLKPGLNIISGWRNTGKTSLIDIVEYCFGRSELGVSAGKIRRTVAWYGLVLRSDGRYVFAGRPAPKPGKARTGDAMFTPLGSPDPPLRDELTVNEDTDSLRGALSAFTGFADTRFDPPEGAARPSLQLHVAHVLPLCLQDEEDIVARGRLFHRGDDRERMQALRDAFPYLVGAADASVPALRAQLSSLRTQARSLRRELDRLLDAERDGDEHGLSLLVRAAKVGLTQAPDLDADPPSGADVLAALRAAAAEDSEAPPSATPTGEREQLLSERRALHAKLADAERDESLLRDFGDDRAAFSAETNEQRARLATLGLLTHEHSSADTCPVCSQVLDEPDPLAETLTRQLHALNVELEGVSDMEPRTRQALEAASAEAERWREQIRIINGALRDLAARDDRARQVESLAASRSRIQGVIEEYLRTAPDISQGRQAELREGLNAIEAQINGLESKVDVEAEQERLQGTLGLIGADMTALARELHLEHSEGQVRLNLGRMTVTVDTLKDGSFGLSRIGGAGTRVGYHLAAHLAIHRLLRARRRPAPAFLILDHPTGPFYPEDPPEGEEPQLKQESDREIVSEIFGLIRSVTEQLGDDLQVLVCDHAAFAGQAWYDNALAEDWRDGRGLIPDGWDVEPGALGSADE